MNKKHKSYAWRIYEKLLLCLASGICWSLVIWVVMILAWNGFSYPEQKIDPFFPRLIFGTITLFFLVVPYYYPGLFILPGWGASLIVFYFQVTSEINFISARSDINSIYYAPDSQWDFYVNWFDIFIIAITLIFLIILLRPALFYGRMAMKEIFQGSGRGYN